MTRGRGGSGAEVSVNRAEAQTLPWQHTSYLSLNFETFAALIVSYVRSRLNSL